MAKRHPNHPQQRSLEQGEPRWVLEGKLVKDAGGRQFQAYPDSALEFACVKQLPSLLLHGAHAIGPLDVQSRCCVFAMCASLAATCGCCWCVQVCDDASGEQADQEEPHDAYGASVAEWQYAQCGKHALQLRAARRVVRRIRLEKRRQEHRRATAFVSPTHSRAPHSPGSPSIVSVAGWPALLAVSELPCAAGPSSRPLMNQMHRSGRRRVDAGEWQQQQQQQHHPIQPPHCPLLHSQPRHSSRLVWMT
jgi:hypothetical protein